MNTDHKYIITFSINYHKSQVNTKNRINQYNKAFYK